MSRKEKLIEQLAHFLADNLAAKSVMLEMKPPAPPLPNLAKEWAKLRTASGIVGWAGYGETLASLKEILK